MKGLAEAFAKGNQQWHKEEWESFIKQIHSSLLDSVEEMVKGKVKILLCSVPGCGGKLRKIEFIGSLDHECDKCKQKHLAQYQEGFNQALSQVLEGILKMRK